jgi:hypothetical protein
MPGGSRQQFVERLGGADETVFGALSVGKHFVEQAFAHTEGREHDGFRPDDADDVFEHQRRIGEQWPPCVGDDLDIGQHVGCDQTAQPPSEVERFLGGNGVTVHHAERVFALNDVDARQGTPRSADRIKRAAAAPFDLLDIGKLGLDDAFGALQRFVRQILQREASERKRQPAANAVAMHVDQLQRTAAEISNDAVRPMHARHDAECRQFRLARTRQDFDFRPANALGLGDEVRAVAGVTAGGSGNRMNAADFHDPAQRPEAPQRGEGLRDSVRCKQPGRLHLAAETAQGLFVEDRDQAAGHGLVDDETYRIRADIDDCNA